MLKKKIIGKFKVEGHKNIKTYVKSLFSQWDGKAYKIRK